MKPAETPARTDYEAVIGLEVHVELRTESKMFCSCSARFGADPNSQVCPVCLGLPGSLPVINRRAVEFGIRAGLALHCEIAPETRFDRKNYFYPDLPKGYQISQYQHPLGRGGGLQVPVDGRVLRVGIRRLHLEEDTGKSIHGGVPGLVTTDPRYSLVDFNRSGVPLMEIVSEPDLRTPAEAVAYLRELRTVLLYTGISDVRMEEGSMRVDVNVSVRPRGQAELGALVEIKNLNSFRSVERALAFDIDRQVELIAGGEPVPRETRHYDEERQITFSSRGKEEAHDYRYFPDPDLVAVTISRDWVAEVARNLPELPDARRRRYAEGFGLPAADVEVLVASPALAAFFDATVAGYPNPRTVANWVLGDLMRLLNAEGLDPAESPLPPEHLASLLKLLDQGTISGRQAKEVLEESFRTGKAPAEVVRARDMVQITDPGQLAPVVDRVVAEHPEVVEQIRGGKQQAMGFLVGQVMKRTRGQANPQVVNRLLREKILN